MKRGATTAATLAAIAGAALAIAGCPRRFPVTRPYPAPAAAELQQALEARQRAVTSMNARARATSWLGGERVRATVLMLVDRPGRLRFEAEVTLQGTVAVLATDGRQFGLYDAMKNQVHFGPACPANVASLIRIPLAPTDIAAILLGDVRLPPPPAGAAGAATDATATDAATAAQVDWDAERGADVLSVPRADGWLRLYWQRPAGQPRLVAVSAVGRDGRGRWRVGFEDFTEIPAAPGSPARVALPQIVRFAEGDESFDDGVEIKFKDRTLNEPPAPDAFILTPPAGASVGQVGCGGITPAKR